MSLHPDFASNLPLALKLKILALASPTASVEPSSHALGSAAPPAQLRVESPHDVDALMRAVARDGFAIVDGFLGEERAREVLEIFKNNRTTSSFTPASMSSGAVKWQDPTVRGDLTNLIPLTNSLPRALSHLSSHMHVLVGIISQKIGVAFNTKALQMSYYPPTGARYVKHRDMSPLSPTRRITLLYYVNEGRGGEDGGELRIYTDEDKEEGQYVDIEPKMDRLLVFLSDMEHEVLPSYMHRYAITLWIHADQPVAESLRRYLTTHHPKPLSERTIFVSIASYRDPETHPTILSLFKSAAHPSRVRVGILYQDDPIIDAQLHPPLPSQLLPFIRAIRVSHTAARGPCPARARIQQELYANEDYYLQIDSHIRFAPEWDSRLISQLERCPAPRKTVLSTYPPGYTVATDGAEKRQSVMGPVVLYPTRFDEDGMLRVSGKLMEKPLGRMKTGLIPQRFVAAGFMFAPGTTLEECLYDARLEGLFFGEEVALAARLWTRGWDFFVPWDVESVDGTLCWHRWDRGYRRTVWEDLGMRAEDEGLMAGQKSAGVMADEEVAHRKRRSQAIVRNLLGMEVVNTGKDMDEDERYGLGNVRTLKEFEEFCGVVFKERKIVKELSWADGCDGYLN